LTGDRTEVWIDFCRRIAIFIVLFAKPQAENTASLADLMEMLSSTLGRIELGARNFLSERQLD
jgi:hypothetical protein